MPIIITYTNQDIDEYDLFEEITQIFNYNLVSKINCSGNNLTSLPDNMNFSNLQYFDCHNNKLTSFVGSPSHVGGDFKCNDNNLTSLDGVPKFVGGSFRCENNPGNFTEQDIRTVCDVKEDIFL